MGASAVARQSREQRGFARAVGAEDNRELARHHIYVDAIEKRRIASAHGHVVSRERHWARDLAISQRKKGAPIALVIRPTGISEGATKVRAPRSAATASDAPRSAEAGIR